MWGSNFSCKSNTINVSSTRFLWIKDQAFVFSSIAITNLLASKRVSRLGKATIIPKFDNIVSLKC